MRNSNVQLVMFCVFEFVSYSCLPDWSGFRCEQHYISPNLCKYCSKLFESSISKPAVLAYQLTTSLSCRPNKFRQLHST